MENVKQLTEFIDGIFQRYDAIRLEFYSMYDDEAEEYFDKPLFVGDDEIDSDTIARLAIHLGMSQEEILSMDQAAARRYWDKYPFFRLFAAFKKEWAWYARYDDKKPTTQEFLKKAIFTEDELSFKQRYSFQDVKKRLIETLKEADTVLPGTFHEDAKITDLVIRTEVFFSFPQCAEMVKSFICMVDHTKELFFKALHEDLPDDEIKELNFLASWLRASDVVMPQVDITYDTICLYRSVYLNENLSDFFSYVKIRRFSYESLFPTDDFVPWRCKEFYEDAKLAQQLVNIFPDVKKRMRRFAKEVLNFSCSFVWSVADKPEEEAHVYVGKTPQELYDWTEYAQRLDTVASPTMLGGLVLPKREINLEDEGTNLRRMKKRMAVKHAGR